MRISDWSSDVFSSDLRRKPSRLRCCSRFLFEPRESRSMTSVHSSASSGSSSSGSRSPSASGCSRSASKSFLGSSNDTAAPDAHVVELTDALFGYEHLLQRLFSERSEEHTSELQSLMRISYAVFCLTKK